MPTINLETTSVDIGLLIPDPDNARKHGDKNVKAVIDSIKQFGQVEPLVVRRQNNVVIGGNCRLQAMKQIGLSKVAVHYVDFDDQKAKALALALNRTAELAEWDSDVLSKTLEGLKAENFDLDSIGFSDEDLAQWVAEPEKVAPGCDEDEVPQVTETICKLGDLWQLGEHRLLCGDSTDVLQVERLMDGRKAGMLAWDPPWNVGFEYNEYDDAKTPQEYLDFISACLNNFSIVAKPDFVAVVWQSEKNWRHFHTIFPQNARVVAVLKNFVQLSKGFLQRAWDPAFMWHGPDFKSFKVSEHNQRDYFLSNTAATYDDGTGIRASGHPCPRQVDVYEYFITGWTMVGENILDLCLGSGTALIACEKTGRKCFGMELDPHYCDVIIKRWETYSGKKASLVTGA